jgi:tetratricopeptide (TPR) repeat protein
MRTCLAVILCLVAVGNSLARAAEGRKFALLVGVERYDHAKLGDLKYCGDDVQALAKVLTSQGYQCTVLRNESDANATQPPATQLPTVSNINTALKSLLGETTKRDLILIVLTGHGLQPAGATQPFFCPADANPSFEPDEVGRQNLDAPDSLIGIGTLLKQLDKSGVGEKFVLVDACRNAPSLKGMKAGVDRVAFELLPDQCGMLLSCSKGQFSFETEKLGPAGRGVFLHHVIEGFEGGARDKKGKVTWNSLVSHVQFSVPETINEVFGSESGARQLPAMIANVEGSPLLATLSPSSSVPAVPMMSKAKAAAEKGRKLLESKLYLEAIPALTDAILLDPRNAELYSLRGEAHTRHDNPKFALDDFSEAVRLDPSNLDYVLDRGEILCAMGMCPQAIIAYREVVAKSAPGDADSYRTRASARSGLADHYQESEQAALADFTEALRRDPGHLPSLQGRASCLRVARRFDESLADYRAALRIDAADCDALTGRARTYLDRFYQNHDKDDLDLADADASEAIRIDPNTIAHHAIKAEVLMKKKDYPASLRAYDECLKRNPRSLEGVTGRGFVFVDQEQYSQAVAEFTKAIEFYPSNVRTRISRASALNSLGQFDRALTDTEKAIEINPVKADFLNIHGIVLDNLKRYKDAVSAYDRAIAINSKDHVYFINRGIAHRNADDLDAALRDYKRAIAMSPKDATCHHALSYVYSDRKQFKEAIETLDEAIRLDPKLQLAWQERARCHYMLDDFGHALSDYAEALKLNPDDHTSYNGRGNVYYAKKEYFTALTEYNRAISLATPPDPYYFYNRGGAYLENKNYDWALDDLNAAIRLKDDDASFFQKRADIYEAKSDSASATQDRETAKRLTK